MAFKMNLKGYHVADNLFKKMREARDMRTHGEVAFVEAIDSGRFNVRMSDGTSKELGEVRLYNLLHADVVSEPDRRKAWLEEHKKAEKKEPTPRGERFKNEIGE